MQYPGPGEMKKPKWVVEKEQARKAGGADTI